MFMDWFTKAFPNLSGWNKFMAVMDPTLAFLQEHVDSHKATLDKNNPRDFIDIYLSEIESTKDPSSSFYKEEGGNY
jgi:hypothetical protein